METFQKALAGLTNKKMAAYLAGLKRIGCMTSLEAGMKVSKGKSGSETRSTLEQRMRAVFFAVRKARDRPIYWATETLSAVVHEPELGVELEGEWLEPELGDELEASDEETTHDGGPLAASDDDFDEDEPAEADDSTRSAIDDIVREHDRFLVMYDEAACPNCVRVRKGALIRELVNGVKELHARVNEILSTMHSTSVVQRQRLQKADREIRALENSVWHTYENKELSSDWSPPRGGARGVGGSSDEALASLLVSRVLLVPGKHWPSCDVANLDFLYRGYVVAVFPEDWTTSEEQFAGCTCLDVWFAEDRCFTTFTVSTALEYLAPFSSMCLSELVNVRREVLSAEIRARLGGRFPASSASAAEAIYGLIHGGRDGPSEASLGAKPASKPPPGCEFDSPENGPGLFQVAKNGDSSLLMNGYVSTLACHASMFSPPQFTSQTDACDSRPPLLLTPKLLSSLKARFTPVSDGRLVPVATLLSLRESSDKHGFAQFAVRGDLTSTNCLIGRWHVVQFKRQDGRHTVSCTCMYHSTEGKRVKRNRTMFICPELAALAMVERSGEESLLGGHECFMVLRDCLSRQGCFKSSLTSEEVRASGLRNTSLVMTVEDKRVAEDSRLSALYRTVAHPIPFDLGYRFPTPSGTVSGWKLSELLDDGERSARRQNQHSYASGAAVRGISFIPRRKWYDIAAMLGDELLIEEPGDAAERDHRPMHVQWVQDFEGREVPFQANHEDSISTDACSPQPALFRLLSSACSPQPALLRLLSSTCSPPPALLRLLSSACSPPPARPSTCSPQPALLNLLSSVCSPPPALLRLLFSLGSRQPAFLRRLRCCYLPC